MPYVVIEDFRAGLDGRKMSASSVPGSLQTLTNAHVTRGGEIQKRLAMVAKFSLPPTQTFGLAGAAGKLYTFGSDPSPAVPSGITYQQLTGSAAMSRVRDTEFFNGKLFVIAEYADASVKHFYDKVTIADFAGGSGAYVAGLKATSALTIKDKLYVTADSIAFFSAIDEPTKWKAADVGAGFKNMANQSAGSETLTGMGRYQNLTAVFARRATQLWYFDPDPIENVQRQVLSNIGTFAKDTITSFGDSDVFFLADSGVRSLRARASSVRAGVTDVGTPIDEELVAYLSTLTEAERSAACAAIDPASGRYILAAGARCYVFSNYTDAGISAWSRYDFGFSISHFVDTGDGRLWARAGNTVYLYGGDNGATYDASPVTVELPYIDGRATATFKQWKAIDIIAEGLWKVEINTDPNKPDNWTLAAFVNGNSLPYQSIQLQAHSPILKLRLTNEAAGPARISKIIMHYVSAEAN